MQEMHADASDLNELTRAIVGCAFRVMNTLGAGFLERVYENVLALELGKAGLAVAQQVSVSVCYDIVMVGAYIVDLLVEDVVLVELKAVKALESIHAAQCINYLKAVGLPVCLLINFGNPRLDVRRVTRSA